MGEKTIEWVSVKFLERATVEIERDGKVERRVFNPGDLGELPKDQAIALFKEGKILPGIQYTTGRIEGISGRRIP